MRIAIGLALMVCVAAIPAQALVPATMNFQGILTNGAGGPVADGSYSVTFSLYNAEVGGVSLWSEGQTVSTSGGLFNTVLGSAVPIPDTALMDSAAFLEIMVETDPPLSPRTRLVSSPFSFMSRALRGEGPVQLERTDPSSGATGSMQLNMEQNATTNDRVKVQFHWNSDYPGTGDSSRYDFIMTPDSTYESRRQHKPFQVCKVVDQATADLQKVVVLCATGSADTAEWSRSVSAVDGVRESTTTTSATGRATGKRRHGPVTFTKEWDATSTLSSAAWKKHFDIDTGFTESATMTKSDLISEMAHEATQTREHILLSRQVGVPGATDQSSLELQTNDTGARAQLHRGTTTDSSGLEILAVDDSTKLTLYSRTTGARYSNIVLKRGFSTGAEFSIGYDGAASSAMIYATSNPAAGAQLGINTTTPTAAFHLVGDGCYTGTFGACSDRRYKENIATITEPLNLVAKLRGVRYDWKREEYPEQQFPAGEQIGLIAQEVEDVVPAVVHTGSDGYKSVDYAKLVALLIEGMKDQQQQIDELKSELAQLRQ